MLKNIFITILLICSVSGVWGQKSVKVKVSGNVIKGGKTKCDK